MDIIERYLYAVCKHLPAKSRKDIEEELRSSIMDELDAHRTHGSPDDKDIIEVLNKFGPPERVARNYTRKGIYLIGPELYDLYFLVLKLAAFCLLVGVGISFIFRTMDHGFMVTDFLDFIWKLCSGILGVIGAVTVTFILAERLNANVDSDNDKAETQWDPTTLPDVPRPCEAIKLSDIIFGLIFTLLIFAFLNFYPILMRNYFQFNDPEVAGLVSLVDLGVIKPYMTSINILFGLAVIRFILLLKDYRYRLHTLVMEMVGNLGALIILILLLFSPSIIEAPPVDLGSIDRVELNHLMDVISTLYRVILMVSGAMIFIDLAKNTVRLIKYQKKAQN